MTQVSYYTALVIYLGLVVQHSYIRYNASVSKWIIDVSLYVENIISHVFAEQHVWINLWKKLPVKPWLAHNLIIRLSVLLSVLRLSFCSMDNILYIRYCTFVMFCLLPFYWKKTPTSGVFDFFFVPMQLFATHCSLSNHSFQF